VTVAGPGLDSSGTRGAAVVALDAPGRHRGEWKALAKRALEPNIFYDPDFALPAAAALAPGKALRGVCVHTDEADRPARLCGLFPFTLSRRWGIPITAGVAFIHPYAMSSAPLVGAGKQTQAVSAFLDWLERGGDAPAAWLFRFLPQDGALKEAFDAALAESGMRCRTFARYERAVLDGSRIDRGDFVATMSPKRRREYRRLRRKLDGCGVVTVTRASAAEDVPVAMREYLALEAAGWKGRCGTAAGLTRATCEMFEAIAGGLGESGQIRVDALRLDGAPAAMAVSCGVGNSWWLWKISYDEAFAAFSPGVLAVLEVSERAIADGERYDSCALPGIPMIERLWRERRPYADMLIVPDRLGALGDVVIQLESLRRQAEMAAKAARQRFRKG